MERITGSAYHERTVKNENGETAGYLLLHETKNETSFLEIDRGKKKLFPVCALCPTDICETGV